MAEVANDDSEAKCPTATFCLPRMFAATALK